MGDAFSD
jgi:hypothetical protein